MSLSKKLNHAGKTAKVEALCKVGQCCRIAIAKEYCQAHYQRIAYGLNNPFDSPIRSYGKKICVVTLCGKKHEAKGYCKAHYARYQKGYRGEELYIGIREHGSDSECATPECDRKANDRGFCPSHATRLRAIERKAILVDEKGRKCIDCDGFFPDYVFDFDHINGKKGRKSISRLLRSGATINRLLEEVEDCELVCANCHRIRTYSRYEPLLPRKA